MMTFPAFEAILQASFSNLSDVQLDRFLRLEAGYRDWNAKINVISRKDIDNLYDHHVLHSLAIAEYLRIHDPEVYSRLRDPRPAGGKPVTLLDVGTGGGFPGIPLAILFPAAAFTLCDSVGKKTRVTGEIARLLGLTNVTVVNARAETLPSRFDYVVSRAVASLTDFYPWVKGKYSKSILYLRGGDLETEISQFRARWRKPESAVRTWPVDAWLKDEYFAGKFVVEIFCKSEQNP